MPMIGAGSVFGLIGGLYGCAGVALAAVASHALHANTSPEDVHRVWMASAMLLAHAPLLLIVAWTMRSTPLHWLVGAGSAASLGSLLFSGSLAAHALFATSTALAPMGGMLLMLSWLLAAIGVARAK